MNKFSQIFVENVDLRMVLRSLVPPCWFHCMQCKFINVDGS